VIESVDSCETAAMIDRASLQLGKKMPVLIEVNSGREPQKSGAMPEDVEIIANQINTLPNVLLFGLMTMGPNVKNPEDLRRYFRETHELFADLDKKVCFIRISQLSQWVCLTLTKLQLKKEQIWCA